MTNEEVMMLRPGHKVFIPDINFDKFNDTFVKIQKTCSYLTVSEVRWDDENSEYVISVAEIMCFYLLAKYFNIIYLNNILNMI